MGVAEPVSDQVRSWRSRRRLSQLELALAAQTTQRHLSFIEQGRSRPGRAVLLRLAEALDVPLRERNALLLAAGHAPHYPESSFDGELLAPVRETVRRVLRAYEPAPAIVVAPGGRLVEANAAFELLTDGAAAHLLAAPVNVYRLALHPEGMAPRIGNLAQWGRHVVHALRTHDRGGAAPAALIAELEGYLPAVAPASEPSGFAVPLQLRCGQGELELVTTITTFATAADVTLAELALEAFLPADPASMSILRQRETARDRARSERAR